jgi:hypothetical protein
MGRQNIPSRLNLKRGERFIVALYPFKWKFKQLPFDASKMRLWLAEAEGEDVRWCGSILETFGRSRGLDVVKAIADAADRKRHGAGEELFSEMLKHVGLDNHVRELGRDELRTLHLVHLPKERGTCVD